MPPGLNPSPGVAGVISPVEGDAENSELCAEAVPEKTSASMSANPRTARRVAQVRNIFGALLMTRAFSAQIAAISSLEAEFPGPVKPHGGLILVFSKLALSQPASALPTCQ